MKPQIILHPDLASFHASVKIQVNPEHRNKPFVIGADPKRGRDRVFVSSCSCEARAFGIRSAMPVYQAFGLCLHAVYFSPGFALCSKVSAEVITGPMVSGSSRSVSMKRSLT